MAILFAGFIAPLLVTWLAFARLDAADDLVYWTLKNNAAYAANPIPWSEALQRFGSYVVPVVLVTLPLWWGAWRARHQHGSAYRDLLVALLIVTTVPALFVGWRFYPHYFIQFYGPLALAAAPWAEPLLRRPLRAPGWRLAAWSGFVLIVAAAVNVALYFGPWRVYREIDPVYRQIAARLEQDACHENATLFVWGHAPVFYYHARLAAASRFVVMAQARLTSYVSGNLASLRGDIEEGGAVVPEHWDWLFDDLSRRGTTYVLDAAPANIYRWNRYPLHNYPRLESWLANEFEKIDTVARVDIYRRKGCQATLTGPQERQETVRTAAQTAVLSTASTAMVAATNAQSRSRMYSMSDSTSRMIGVAMST